MIWDRLRRHHAQIDRLRRAIARSRPGQAYLFIGPSGIGKRYVARGVAQCLFCERHTHAELQACGACPPCRQVAAETHPDLLMIGCPEGKQELPIELLVGSREHRGREGLCHELALRPMQADRRLAIIDDVDRLGDTGANALLKTLEEPPPGSILFLISPSLDAVLPTIQSRCQTLTFFPLLEEEIVELILEQGWTEDRSQAQAAAKLARGSLSAAHRFLDPGVLRLRELIRQTAHEPQRLGMLSAGRLIEQIDELAHQGPEQRELARLVILSFVEEWQVGKPAAGLPEQELEQRIELIERCALAEQHLEAAMPVAMCLEAFLADSGRLLRT